MVGVEVTLEIGIVAGTESIFRIGWRELVAFPFIHGYIVTLETGIVAGTKLETGRVIIRLEKGEFIVKIRAG